MATFTIYKDRKNEYRWRLQANNNRITADSGEGYTTKHSCEQAIERVKRDVANATVEDSTVASTRRW
jgi:uncharacterized protein YegP (UPF0339 family)